MLLFRIGWWRFGLRLHAFISSSELSLSSLRRQKKNNQICFQFYTSQDMNLTWESFFRSCCSIVQQECTNPSFDEVTNTFHKRLELSLASGRQRITISETPKTTNPLCVWQRTWRYVMENEGGMCSGACLPTSAFFARVLAGRTLSNCWFTNCLRTKKICHSNKEIMTSTRDIKLSSLISNYVEIIQINNLYKAFIKFYKNSIKSTLRIYLHRWRYREYDFVF